MLRRPQLEQLRQRITVSYHLRPLDAEETAAYINHRLKRAAIGTPLEFPRDVRRPDPPRSRGVPRIINVIADATLLFALRVDRRDIDLPSAEKRSPSSTRPACLPRITAKAATPRVPPRCRSRTPRRPCASPTGASARTRGGEPRARAPGTRTGVNAQQRVVEEQARLLAAARSAAPSANEPFMPPAAATDTRLAPCLSCGAGGRTAVAPRVASAVAPQAVPVTLTHRSVATGHRPCRFAAADLRRACALERRIGPGETGTEWGRTHTRRNRILVPTAVQVQTYRPSTRMQLPASGAGCGGCSSA